MRRQDFDALKSKGLFQKYENYESWVRAKYPEDEAEEILGDNEIVRTEESKESYKRFKEAMSESERKDYDRAFEDEIDDILKDEFSG
jgi:hypothetical protein